MIRIFFMIKITVNGEDRDIPAKLSIKALIDELKIDSRKVAIERNLAIVPRSQYERTEVSEGDKIEIVNFVGGG